MSEEVTFALLGPVRMWRSGTEVPAGSPQQKALIAMLLLHEGRVASIDELTAALWDDAPPRGAFGTLRTYVSRLRRLLDGTNAAVDTGAGGYALHTAPGSVDVAQFETLVRNGRQLGRGADLTGAVAALTDALALWQGEGLDGVPGTYAANQRVRLQEERMAATSLRIAALLDTGSPVVPELTSMVESHPYREELRALLMRALYRDGRQADAIDTFHDGARLLKDELGLDPGHALREMYQRILESDPTLAVVAPTADPHTSVLRPAQLPADQRDFVGRERELAWADALLDPELAPTSALISGMGGVGKSSLALYWAHRNIDTFPDGQLYVDLRGFDHSRAPLDPQDALVILLESLGISGDHVPDTLDARAALYRSALAGRRVLVLLDNARDAEQVRPLLPGASGSLALITSRDRLVALRVTGTESVHLDVLGDDDGATLLLQRAGRDHVDADSASLAQIVRAAAGLPLALAVVGARLRDARDVPFATVAGELRSARAVLDSLGDPDPTVDVRAVLSWSCNNLDTLSLQVLCELAVLPEAPFDVAAARSATGSRDLALLETLVRASLLVRTGSTQYAMHDLVRAYAREVAAEKPDMRQAAIGRAMDHFIGSANEATILLEPIRVPLELPVPAPGAEIVRPADATAALTWLAEHRGVLHAAVETAVAEGLDEQAWQLTWCLATYLHRAEYWSDAIALWRVGLAAAERCGSVVGRARTHQGLGVAQGVQSGLGVPGSYVPGSAQDATYSTHTHLTEAVRLYMSVDMPSAAAWALVSLGSYNGAGTKSDAVADALQRAIELSDEPSLHALALNNLAVHYTTLGDLRRARATAHEALARLAVTDDAVAIAHATDTLGIVQLADGDARAATVSFFKAARAFADARDLKNQGTSLANLGDAYAAAGDPTAAAAVRAEALDLLHDTRDPVADRLRNLLGHAAGSAA
ncbi:BTAD domain-containing putative transcriptional regulator [Promicromonospora sukumoe]|uniref:AfsR/SARP family transcriptional regulator n=1 Tax=Promicromonospora sukumoe TaxID=88382 RepID=UPI0037C7DE27